MPIPSAIPDGRLVLTAAGQHWLRLPCKPSRGLPANTAAAIHTGIAAPDLTRAAIACSGAPTIAGSATTHRVLGRPKQHDGNQAGQPFPDSPDCKHADGNGAATANGRSKYDRDQPWNR